MAYICHRNKLLHALFRLLPRFFVEHYDECYGSGTLGFGACAIDESDLRLCLY